MVFGVIGLLAAGLGVLFFVSQGMGAKPRLQVKVLDVVDGKSVKVQTKDEVQVVKLGGIGYPTGDERSIVDGCKLISDLTQGRTFEMEVLNEREGEVYVNLRSLGGESLNELMLSLGFARYSAAGVGFRQNLIAAESKARANRKGIWNSNRELFRNAANSHSAVEKTVEKDQAFAR
jgi:endonuclease YncB( thermonuclease family)